MTLEFISQQSENVLGRLGAVEDKPVTDATATRQQIVAEARSWIGTRYHACADAKGTGVDCGMLLVRVFVDCGLVAPFDPRPYPIDWHLHRSEHAIPASSSNMP